MTELNYQTPQGNSRTITAAWITLLVLGILYCMGGLCIGTSGLLLMALMTRMPGASARPGAFLFLIIGGSGMMALTVGVTYIWTGMRVRLRSRMAAKVARIVCIINAVLLGSIPVIAIIAAIVTRGNGTDAVSMVLGILLYSTLAAANAIGAWQLGKVMRELSLQ